MSTSPVLRESPHLLQQPLPSMHMWPSGHGLPHGYRHRLPRHPADTRSPWDHRRRLQRNRSFDHSCLNAARRLGTHILATLYGDAPINRTEASLPLETRRALAQQRRIAHLGRNTHHPTITVTSAHACVISPTVAEVALVVNVDARPRAVALRLEAVTHQWQVTAFEIG